MKKVIVFSVLVLTSWIALAQKNSSVENTEDLRSVVYLQQVYQITAEASGFVSGNTNQRITRVLQIGNDNAVTSKTLSENANLNYIQLGSKNSIESYSSIKNYSERIFQRGNNNEVLNYSFGTVDNASFNLLQSGNNLSFQKIGTNSQTDNMSFRFTGADRAVIVRSY